MPSFERLFIKSKGKPIQYKGKTLVMHDLIPIQGEEVIKVVFEEVHSEWEQGVILQVDGFFVLKEKIINDGIVLWHSKAYSKETILRVNALKGGLSVRNAWDTGDGVVQSWHNGAAMIVERNDCSNRYLCNDGHPDENFNDIIFSITKIGTTLRSGLTPTRL